MLKSNRHTFTACNPEDSDVTVNFCGLPKCCNVIRKIESFAQYDNVIHDYSANILTLNYMTLIWKKQSDVKKNLQFSTEDKKAFPASSSTYVLYTKAPQFPNIIIQYITYFSRLQVNLNELLMLNIVFHVYNVCWLATVITWPS